MADLDEARFLKRFFVEHELVQMLFAATEGYIVDATYWTRGADEFVGLCTENGEVFNVNVSCDSRWAIAKDVMKEVAKKFE